jgi:hypothetical protein
MPMPVYGAGQGTTTQEAQQNAIAMCINASLSMMAIDNITGAAQPYIQCHIDQCLPQ